MDTSFGRLPGELRNEIFELAMPCDNNIKVAIISDAECWLPTFRGLKQVRAAIGGLHASCRQAREEASSIFWAEKRVTIHYGLQPCKERFHWFEERVDILRCGLRSFLDMMGPQHASEIRHLVVEVDWVHDEESLRKFDGVVASGLVKPLRKAAERLHKQAKISLQLSVQGRARQPRLPADRFRYRQTADVTLIATIPITNVLNAMQAVDEACAAEQGTIDAGQRGDAVKALEAEALQKAKKYLRLNKIRPNGGPLHRRQSVTQATTESRFDDAMVALWGCEGVCAASVELHRKGVVRVAFTRPPTASQNENE
ncbi:hypothetical protein LTR10_006991 [Elasticomyces elasticus]|nr:hypothetical protein LTR10_006991 [Elasticomyces elasticus]KAK4978809.1 hypothetical protein LTR42_001309 [Elasticomyces elasticus]